MGRLYASLEEVRDFLESQHVFFVATAPSGRDGHVNLSPKGLDGFRILGPSTAAYVDYPGSGVETIAHLRDDGRIVVMFCAFDGAPRIVRLWGRGDVVEPGAPEFPELVARFAPALAVRAVIRIHVTRIGSSCGYGVPRYDYAGERDVLVNWANKKGADGLAAYQAEKNRLSIDGLPGLTPADPPEA